MASSFGTKFDGEIRHSSFWRVNKNYELCICISLELETKQK
jgi:hypothetical protein